MADIIIVRDVNENLYAIRIEKYHYQIQKVFPLRAKLICLLVPHSVFTTIAPVQFTAATFINHILTSSAIHRHRHLTAVIEKPSTKLRP